MVKKKSFVIVVSIIYIGIMLMSAWKMFDEIILSEGFYNFDKSNLTANEWLIYGMSVAFLMIFFLIISLFKNHALTTLYLCFLGFLLASKRFYKDKIDITDNKNNEYYRNLLKEYSIGELAYINDFKITNNDLAASLMMLELKKKIIIQDRINVIDNSNVELVENEKYLLECLYSNKNINIMEYKQYVFMDCVNNGLLIEKNNLKKRIIKKIVFFVILMILLMLWPSFYNQFFVGKFPVIDFLFAIVSFLSFLIIIILPTGYFSYLIWYIIMSKINPSVRSKKGRELNKKLNGLKNFLKDFSRIQERNREELIIWKDYLIYSVIFEQNNDIRDEILRKITF